MDTGVPRQTSVPLAAGVSSIDPATITDPNTGQPNGNLQTVYYVNPNIKTGYASMYNLTVQQEVSPSLSLEVGYVGAISRDLPYAIGNINQNGLQSGVVTPYLGKIQALESAGWGTYNSLQVKLKKRATKNLSLLASYTWGHNLDNGPAPFNLGRNNNPPQSPLILRSRRHLRTLTSDKIWS